MTYEDFKGELYRIIMQQEEVKGKKILLLEKGFTSGDSQMLSMIRYINRVNFGREDCVVQDDYIHVVWGDGNIRSMMNWSVKEYYEKFERIGWEGILPELLTKIHNAGQSLDWLNMEANGYEACKERLIIRPINYDKNKYELENCIYFLQGDIALTLYGIVTDQEEDFVTMKITEQLIEEWPVSDEMLLKNAMYNTQELMPPRLYYSTDLRKSHKQSEGIFMPDEADMNAELFEVKQDDELEGALGYRLSTTKGINGAVAFFYPGVRERLGEIMGGDYYVGFTSIHEAIIHPVDRQDALHMRDSIRDINRIFPGNEMLSNRVYRYDTRKCELTEV